VSRCGATRYRLRFRQQVNKLAGTTKPRAGKVLYRESWRTKQFKACR
jgi:hypothetical protein